MSEPTPEVPVGHEARQFLQEHGEAIGLSAPGRAELIGVALALQALWEGTPLDASEARTGTGTTGHGRVLAPLLDDGLPRELLELLARACGDEQLCRDGIVEFLADCIDLRFPKQPLDWHIQRSWLALIFAVQRRSQALPSSRVPDRMRRLGLERSMLLRLLRGLAPADPEQFVLAELELHWRGAGRPDLLLYLEARRGLPEVGDFLLRQRPLAGGYDDAPALELATAARALDCMQEQRRRTGDVRLPVSSRVLSELAEAVRRDLAGEAAFDFLLALQVPLGADSLRFRLGGGRTVDFGSVSSLLRRAVEGTPLDRFDPLLAAQPSLLPALARVLRGPTGEQVAGPELLDLLERCPAVLDELLADARPPRWLPPLLAGEMRFIGLAEGEVRSPLARLGVLAAVGSPAVAGPMEASLVHYLRSEPRPDKQAIARLVDGTKVLTLDSMLRLLRTWPRLGSVLARSQRLASAIRLDPRPVRALLAGSGSVDDRAAVLVSVGIADPHITNRLLRRQLPLVRSLSSGLVDPHHRFYAFAAVGTDEADVEAVSAFEAVVANWADSAPAIDRRRVLAPFLDHPCVKPPLIARLVAGGQITAEEALRAFGHRDRAPAGYGPDPFPWTEPPLPPPALTERLVSWLCSAPPARLSALGPELDPIEVLRLARVSWRRDQISLPVLLHLGWALGFGSLDPGVVGDALVRFLGGLEPAERRRATAELLDLVQPVTPQPREVAVRGALIDRLPAAVQDPARAFAIELSWASAERAGLERERQASALLDAVEQRWKERRPRRAGDALAPLFEADRAAVAPSAAIAVRRCVQRGLRPRWLVPAAVAGAHAALRLKLLAALTELRVRSEVREVALEALADGYPHRDAVDAALQVAEVGPEYRAAVLDRCADDILPSLFRDVLGAAIAGAPGHGLARDTIVAFLSAHESSPRAVARALRRVASKLDWANADPGWARGLLFALGKLREPLGGKVPRLLAKLEQEVQDPELLLTLRTQRSLFGRDNLNRGRKRRPEVRVAEARKSLLRGLSG